MRDSVDPEYARGLKAAERAWWKRLFDVQRPYRNHLRRLTPGFVLDVGCGLGRNLQHCGGRGVGIDPNPAMVAECRARDLTAFTPDEFAASQYATDAQFDTLLISHVLEHLTRSDAITLVARYVPRIKPGGRAILITPQEWGFWADRTHVEFVDLAALDDISRAVGLDRIAAYSFPLPRPFGRVFRYNEFVQIARKPELNA
jgi:2-polyprenyl-3-methyl-5-hydroxy-6-metoxy-1,4-benzoquinol methylase